MVRPLGLKPKNGFKPQACKRFLAPNSKSSKSDRISFQRIQLLERYSQTFSTPNAHVADKGQTSLNLLTLDCLVGKVKSDILAEPIMVGRDQEISELKLNLEAAIKGKGTTVFVSGEAGSGKTRLTNEFLKFARKKGASVLSGWCLSNVAMPYFPFLEALQSYFSENEEESRSQNYQQLRLKTLLTTFNRVETQQKQESVSSEAWKDQMFAKVAKELLFISTDKPLVIFIDDLHWADSASLALLHYIARTIGSERILILTTFRSEELFNTEVLAGSLLDRLRLMEREDLFKEVKLRNLSILEVNHIAENMLGGNIGVELGEKLAQESHGNPLFIIESLRMLYENDSLIQEKGEWHLAVGEFGIPTKVKDVILRRLSVLKPNQRRTLDVASIIGDKFEPQLIGAVLNQDSLEVLETLNTIALSKSLICVEGDRYRFDHAKSREVLYEEILLPLKKGYHEKVAEKIESLLRKSEALKVIDLAYHYSQAGNKEKSLEYSLLAGKDALSRFSNAEAIKYFTYVIQIVGEDQKFASQRLAALEGLGDTLYANSMFNEASKNFERLAEESIGLLKLRALRKAIEANLFQAFTPHVLDLIKKAEECSNVDRMENARFLRIRAQILLFRQFMPELALKDCEEALQIFEEENSIPDVAYLLMPLGATYASLGQLENGIGAMLRSIAILGELGDFRRQTEAYIIAGEYCFAGLGPEMLTMFSSATKTAETINNYNVLAAANRDCGWALEMMGKAAEALAWSLEALKFSEKTDSAVSQCLIYGNLVREYTMLGNTKLADEYYFKFALFSAEVLSNPLCGDFSKAVYFAGKGQWEESTQCFNRCLLNNVNSGYAIWSKRNFAWALERQGQSEEEKINRLEAQKIVDMLEKTVEHVNIQPSLIAPVKVTTDQIFEARLDLVNASRTHGSIVSIENIIPSGFNVINHSQNCTIQNKSLELKDKIIESFEVISIKFTLKATKSGLFKISPKVFYMNDLKETKTKEIKPIIINVIQTNIRVQLRNDSETKENNFEFKSVASRKAFDFLTNAFNEDYIRRKLPSEWSGWRTLMEIVKQGHLSKHSMYGQDGRGGKAKKELEYLGLVESRFFFGERGRGGRILKLRIRREKEK